MQLHLHAAQPDLRIERRPQPRKPPLPLARLLRRSAERKPSRLTRRGNRDRASPAAAKRLRRRRHPASPTSSAKAKQGASKRSRPASPETPKATKSNGRSPSKKAKPKPSTSTPPTRPRRLRAKGGAIQVRAIVDGGAPGYSVPVNATVNRSIGGPKDATAPIGPGSVDLLTGNFTVRRHRRLDPRLGLGAGIQPAPTPRAMRPRGQKACSARAGSPAPRSNRRAAQNGAASRNSSPPKKKLKKGSSLTRS